MGDSGFNRRDDIFSNPVRAGKRTYFFDVKATRNDDYYITVTESKRRMDDNGKFIYDKHKIFLYKEDFDKFTDGLKSCVDFIRENKGEEYGHEYDHVESGNESSENTETTTDASATEETKDDAESTSFSDIEFDDLGKNSTEG